MSYGLRMAEIHCSFSNASYASAQKGLALLFCSREVLFEPDEWVLFIQIHGHLTANLKWLKDSRAFDRYVSFQRPPNSILDHVLRLPESPTFREKSGSDYRQYCIFTTAKIPVSPVSLYEKGLLVEFDFPVHMLPSYRGRCAHISYYLTVTMQHSTVGSTKRLHFPLHVNSSGCPQDEVYYVKSGGILAFSPDTISAETFYDTSTLHIISTEHDHSLESQSSHSTTSPPATTISAATFKVRDEGLICNVSVPSLRFLIGKSTCIAVDFTDQEQDCYAIKASILQTEVQIIAKGHGPSYTSQVCKECAPLCRFHLMVLHILYRTKWYGQVITFLTQQNSFKS